ncbi:hypothetical protein QTP70_023931 [Hemibagrus guttatus]|uniref:General transcription factor IIIC, polypeptide 2, beta n=1 Tax=Hemibagrus guttatus TaxID=175788 RepID=A0AAE0UHZ0_9TELE|nr:hypothetical protein QTP70_023931 [Hemibagrus guttatus]
MGVPCNPGSEVPITQNIHMDGGSGGDVDGETLETKVLQDSDNKSNMFEEKQEMHEGQTAASSQAPSDTDQEVLPAPEKSRRRGRPRRFMKNDESLEKTKSVNVEAADNLGVIPENPGVTSSGRPKRKAAKVALEYLHNISKDLETEKSEKSFTKRKQNGLERSSSPTPRKASGRGRGKRKAPDYDSDQNDDADFDPGDQIEVESEEDEDEDEDYADSMSFRQQNKKTQFNHKVIGINGLSSCTMQPVWTSFRNTKEFRDQHSSPWVFPEWIPSLSDWKRLSDREEEKYLPQEKESMSFMLCREGVKGQPPLQRVKRFESLSPNSERWDSLFFAGGPVWAMEWCPVPEGAAHTQYTALYCNRNMDDRHKANTLHTGHALLQLWDLGELQMCRPLSSPCLAYALAVDDGCIWSIKWCPAGAWELPTTVRKAPHLPRLGLIAAAFSNGNIAVYSLPHPEHLTSQSSATGESSQTPQIYRVQRIMTVKVGSSQADHSGRSGLCFTLDWLPVKPHNLLAAGFCDGNLYYTSFCPHSSLPTLITAHTHPCPHSSLPTVFPAHTHPCPQSSLPTLIPAHTHPCPHSSLPTVFPAHSLSCPQSSLPTVFPAHSLPCPHSSLPTVFPAHTHPCPHSSLPTLIPAHSLSCPQSSLPTVFPAHSLPCPHSSLPTVFPAHSLPCPHSSLPTLIPAHTHPCPHSSLPTVFPAHSLPCPQSSLPTLFPAHTLPCPQSSLPTVFPAHSLPCPHSSLPTLITAHTHLCTVALWDLSSTSPLLRVRSPDGSFSLYPYHCFLAHDSSIRRLSWCRASSDLMVTVGEDRMVKLWNLTKTYTSLKAIKRFLHTDVSWPIFWPGVFVTQESCYATLGQQGLHYLDSGYFNHKAFFVCSRKATVWSFSMSDWMNSCVIGDNIGEFVYSVLCDPNCNYSNSKRHRFPVYRAELVPFEPGQRSEDAQQQEEEEEEEHDSVQQEPQTYRGAVRKYYLRFHDMDLRSFTKYQQRPIVKQLQTSETKGLLSVDQLPLNALYKVCFNPNMDAHGWVLSAGQSGLVRAHCVSGLEGPVMHKLIREAQAQFNTMFRSQEKEPSATVVQQRTAETVRVP